MNDAEMRQRLHDMRRRSWEERKLSPYQSVWDALRLFFFPSWRWLVLVSPLALGLLIPMLMHRRVNWHFFTEQVVLGLASWLALALLVGFLGWFFNERRYRQKLPGSSGKG